MGFHGIQWLISWNRFKITLKIVFPVISRLLGWWNMVPEVCFPLKKQEELANLTSQNWVPDNIYSHVLHGKSHGILSNPHQKNPRFPPVESPWPIRTSLGSTRWLLWPRPVPLVPWGLYWWNRRTPSTAPGRRWCPGLGCWSWAPGSSCSSLAKLISWFSKRIKLTLWLFNIAMENHHFK